VTPYRGGLSAKGLEHVIWNLLGTLDAGAIQPPSLGGHGDLFGHGPHTRAELPGHRDDDLMRVFPPCAELPRAFTQADLGLPTPVLDRRGELFEAAWQVPTDLGWGAIGPGPFHQSPTGMAMPGLREACLASALATGIFRRRQAPIMHEGSGVIDAGQVAECSDGRDRPGQRPATEGWHRVHDRAAPPGGDLLVEFLFQALEPVRVFGDRPAICLADDVLGGGGTDDLAQPASVRRAPRGPTGIADLLPPQNGVEAELGRLQIVERLFPRAAQVTNRFVLDRWDIDRREVPGAHQARPWDGLTTIRVDTVPGLLRDQGRGDDPAAVAFWGQIAREPRAAGAGFIDQDAWRALGLPLPDALVAITLPGPDRAQRTDFRALCWGDRGDREGRFMDIHSDVERARLSHG
jgi:hypothetical protein